MQTATRFDKYLDKLESMQPYKMMGRVVKITGLVIESAGPVASVGEMCRVTTRDGKNISAEVVGFRDKNVLLMPHEGTVGLHPGSYVSVANEPYSVAVGPEILGRVLDGTGKPIDGQGAINAKVLQPVHNLPPNPLKRERVD